MKQVSIRNIVIPSRSRSGNYPTGSTVIPGGGGSNATIDLSKYMKLALWLENFEAKTDTDGNQYIYAKKPLVSVGGFIAYCSDEAHVPSIFEGIPIDNDTIYWDESTGVKILKAKGSDGGSDFDATKMWSALSAATNEQINKSHLTTALSGYAIKSDLNISNWDAAYSWGNHAAAGYAKQTALDDVSTKLNDFLEGSDTDTIINKWKELEAFLAGMSETDNLAEILATKADKSYVDTELTKYVTLATEQTIDGLKHFTNGLTIGATKHKIYEKDGNILIEGNVLVTGGITAYSDGSSSGGSSGGLDVDLMWQILGSESDEQIHKSHLTTALSGYATESWVTSQNYLTSVNWSQIQNKPTTLGGYGITDAYTKTDSDNRFVNVSGDTMTGNLKVLDIFIGYNNEINSSNTLYLGYRDTLQGVNVCHNNKPFTYGSSGYTVWHAGNDGHGSGMDADTIDGYQASQLFVRNRDVLNLTDIDNFVNRESGTYLVRKFDSSGVMQSTGLLAVFRNTDASTSALEILTWYDWSMARIRMSIDSNRYTPWKDLAFLDSNVASATKLQTARSIWGQNFDGTGNIDGNLILKSSSYPNIDLTSTNNTEASIYYKSTSVTKWAAGLGCWGVTDNFTIGVLDNGPKLSIDPNGNVGIGTTSPTYKLQVIGDVYSRGTITNVIYDEGSHEYFLGKASSGLGASYKGLLLYAYENNPIFFYTSNQLRMYINSLGNTGIGTTSPAYKLDVNGDIHTNAWIRSTGNVGWYSETYNGGIYMTEGNYVRVYNNKAFLVENSNHYALNTNGGYYSSWNNSFELTDANTLNYALATYNKENATVNHGTVQPQLVWGNQVSGYGYMTRYSISSIRYTNNGWGRMRLAVGNSDNGTSIGCYLDVDGDGFVEVGGNILATGGVTCYSSDQRAKTVIEQIKLSLKQIANAPTIRFKWNDWKIKDDGKTHIGGIAQYMQAVLPETVLEADGMLNLDYATTGYVFAVQTARYLLKTDTEVEKLKKRVKKLEKQLKQLGYEEVNIMDD